MFLGQTAGVGRNSEGLEGIKERQRGFRTARHWSEVRPREESARGPPEEKLRCIYNVFLVSSP